MGIRNKSVKGRGSLYRSLNVVGLEKSVHLEARLVSTVPLDSLRAFHGTSHFLRILLHSKLRGLPIFMEFISIW